MRTGILPPWSQLMWGQNQFDHLVDRNDGWHGCAGVLLWLHWHKRHLKRSELLFLEHPDLAEEVDQEAQGHHWENLSLLHWLLHVSYKEEEGVKMFLSILTILIKVKKSIDNCNKIIIPSFLKISFNLAAGITLLHLVFIDFLSNHNLFPIAVCLIPIQ